MVHEIQLAIIILNYVTSIFMPYSIQLPLCQSRSNDGTTPTAGENYCLICRVSGAENLNPIVMYRWIKNSDQSQVGISSSTLSFTLLQLSDTASYVREATIASSYL